MNALIIGATGAVGRDLVGELLSSPQWKKVVTISRRPLDELPPCYKDSADLAKLEQKIVPNLDEVETHEASKTAYDGVDAAFCALGTTRATAGSAEGFLKVDYDYVATAARMAKASGSVRHFSLCSAAGANASLPAPKWKLLHGLLYSNTKGRAENAVKEQGFESVGIFRPGLLGRGDLTRKSEGLWKQFVPWTPSRTVARAMVLEAERVLKEGKGGVKVLNESAIQRYPGAAVPPVSA